MTHITIKPADKNLGTVVLTTDYYNALCLKLLSDETTYVIPSNFYPSVIYARLRHLLTYHEINKDSRLAKSLLQLEKSDKVALARFYCLIKMHKKNQPISGRPIVSSINTPTYHASVYLHNVFFPILKLITHICHSSASVLRDLSSLQLDPTKSYKIGCADVKSLYPSIPTDYGLHAMKIMVDRYKNLYPLKNFNRQDLEFLLALLEWVLKNNYFTFNNTTYHQISGTAMGTPVAVVYANLVLFHLEESLIESEHPIFYRRYIDDLFIIAEEETITRFFQRFSAVHPSIKLESITIGQSGIFLDLELSLQQVKSNDGDNIITSYRVDHKIYQKEINRYLYITPFSNHTRSNLRNIISNEIRRYRMMCVHDLDYFNIVGQFFQRLQARGFSDSFLLPLFHPKVFQLVQNDLLNPSKNVESPTSTKAKPIITLKISTNTLQSRLKSLLSFPSIITDHPEYKSVFGNNNTVLGRKHGKNVVKYFLHK